MSDIADLLVIGGGINGAGIARDAALRGLDVVLVERDDIGAGTTSDSTKLIHGGLRYLEHFEFPLVHESLRERERLLALAPHLVRPLRFLIPIYRGGPYPRPMIRAGLVLYDLMAGFHTRLPRSQAVSARALCEAVPALASEDLLGGFAYRDAQAPYPERLCLENILDAHAAGARILTRCEVVGFLRKKNRILGVVARGRDDGGESTLRARLVINAAGPWVDAVLGLVDRRIAGRMGGTRGMHMLLPRRPGGPDVALYTPARADGRPFFVIPWREYYWVGTTEVPQPDPDAAVPTAAERGYLLRELGRLLPGLHYTPDDIFYVQSGVRPLRRHDFRKPGAVTRRHTILDHRESDGLDGLISIIGGKLTTYRSLAEEAVDKVFEHWGKRPPPCPTRDRPLPGSGSCVVPRGADVQLVAHLVGLYGSRAEGVLALAGCASGLAERLDPCLPNIAAEVVWAVRHEFARHLDDVLLRRTGIGTGHTEGLGCLDKVAGLMAGDFGWSPDTCAREIERYHAIIDRDHRVHG